MITEQKKILIDRMNDMKKLIPDTIEAINSLPNDIDGDFYTILKPGQLQINIEYKPSQYLILRRLLAKNWRYCKHNFNKYTGNYYIYFDHRTMNVELSLELEISTEFEEGASCRLVEIDHKTEVIYGLECE